MPLLGGGRGWGGVGEPPRPVSEPPRDRQTRPIARATPGNLPRAGELLDSSGLNHSSVIPDTCPFGKGSGGSWQLDTRSVGKGVESRVEGELGG